MKTDDVLKTFARDKRLKKNLLNIILQIQYKEKGGGSKELHI